MAKHIRIVTVKAKDKAAVHHNVPVVQTPDIPNVSLHLVPAFSHLAQASAVDTLESDVEGPAAGLRQKIEEALAGLGEDQRMAFVLREYEGLDYAAIAEVTGVSEGTVKSRLHRAKEALRQRLEPYVRTGA